MISFMQKTSMIRRNHRHINNFLKSNNNTNNKFKCKNKTYQFFSSSSSHIDLDHSAKIQLKALRQAMQGKGKFEELGIGGLDNLLSGRSCIHGNVVNQFLTKIDGL